MKKWLAFLGLAFTLTTQAQNVTLSGYIRDAASGEELISASIVNESRQGTVTNIYGFYSLTLPAGEYTFTISYIGYETMTKKINLNASQTVNFELKEATNELQEVQVTAKKLDENLNRAEMSTTQLTAKQIKTIPQFLGEFDVIRSITLLPGVTTVGEGASDSMFVAVKPIKTSSCWMKHLSTTPHTFSGSSRCSTEMLFVI